MSENRCAKGAKQISIYILDFCMHISMGLVALGLAFTANTAKIALTNIYIISANYEKLWSKQKLRWDPNNSKK